MSSREVNNLDLESALAIIESAHLRLDHLGVPREGPPLLGGPEREFTLGERLFLQVRAVNGANARAERFENQNASAGREDVIHRLMDNLCVPATTLTEHHIEHHLTSSERVRLLLKEHVMLRRKLHFDPKEAIQFMRERAERVRDTSEEFIFDDGPRLQAEAIRKDPAARQRIAVAYVAHMREKMERLALPVSKVSAFLKVSPTTLRKWLAGESTPNDPDVIHRIVHWTGHHSTGEESAHGDA